MIVKHSIKKLCDNWWLMLSNRYKITNLLHEVLPPVLLCNTWHKRDATTSQVKFCSRYLDKVWGALKGLWSKKLQKSMLSSLICRFKIYPWRLPKSKYERDIINSESILKEEILLLEHFLRSYFCYRNCSEGAESVTGTLLKELFLLPKHFWRSCFC